MPEAPEEMGFSRDEVFLIEDAEKAMIAMTKNLVMHLDTLTEYLQEIKQEAPMKQNFSSIKSHAHFKSFKETFTSSKGVNVMKNKVEELISSTFNRINGSFNNVLDNTLAKIDKQSKQLDKTYSARRYTRYFDHI